MQRLHACTKHQIEYSSDAYFSYQRDDLETIISDNCICNFNRDTIGVNRNDFYELIESIKNGDLNNDENFMHLTNDENEDSIPVSELIEDLTNLYNEAQEDEGYIYLEWF